jgi:hypothetical protein
VRAEKQEFFAYTDEQLTALVKTLSVERMKPYIVLASDDRRLALNDPALAKSMLGRSQPTGASDAF